MSGTWTHLSTRRGQLIEMAATLSQTKGQIEAVMEDYPEEACGSAWLEEAIGLIGRAETAIDEAVDSPQIEA